MTSRGLQANCCTLQQNVRYSLLVFILFVEIMSDYEGSSSSVSEAEGENSRIEETDMTNYNSVVQPYKDEPLAEYDENYGGEENIQDEDGICYATLEARFDKRESINSW